MELLAALQRSGGIEALARQAAVSTEHALAASKYLLPPLMLALRRHVRASGGGRDGVQRLLDLIAVHGDGALAADVMGMAALDAAPGREILAILFDDPDYRRQQIALFANPEPLGDGEVEVMFPMLAMLVCGYISAQAKGSGAADSGGLDSLGAILQFLISDANDADCIHLL
jgi:hypothetical protein